MPTAYSGQQKAKIQGFVVATNSSEKSAVKFLKANDWDLQRAADSYFRSAARVGSGYARPDLSALNHLFEKYREDSSDDGDKINVEGTMKYMEDLGVKLDDIAVLAVGEALQCPTTGEITRSGFLTGWSSFGADSIPKQKAVVAKLRKDMEKDDAYFRRIYKYTFELARTPMQRAIDLELAIVYWRLLFDPQHGRGWQTSHTAWLDEWITFLQKDWQRAVNRDLWDMTYDFRRRTLEDDSLAWWDVNSAWPSVIDEFVIWLKRRRNGETPSTSMSSFAMESNFMPSTDNLIESNNTEKATEAGKG